MVIAMENTSNESSYAPPMPFEEQSRVLTEVMEALSGDSNQELRESLDEVRRMIQFEDRGWQRWWGSAWGVGDELHGLTLEEVQEVSKEIRSQVTGGSLLKNGVELRSGFIWSKGFLLPGTERPKGRGAPTKLRQFCLRQSVQECLLSPTASYEMEKAAYSDGNYLLLGVDGTKELHRVALAQVLELYTNPQFIEEVWAYKIELPNTVPSQSEPEVRWVYTDRYPADRTRRDSITTNSEQVAVKLKHTIFDARFNRQVGQPLGTPDALPAVAWARSYSEGMKGGLQMQKALAFLAFKVTSKTAKGSQNAGAKVAGGTGSGRTATMVDGQDMNPLSSAGRGYDFSSLRDVAGMVASAIQVSVVSLLASPSASGSSYGAAATLEKPQQDAMRQRQQVWADYIARITYWVTGDYVRPIFPAIVDEDPYRSTQRLGIAWGSGVLHPDEMRAAVIHLLGIEPLHDAVPEGIMLPNNERSEARTDIDPSGSAYTGPNSNDPSFSSSPGQGVANGTGGQGSVNDQRTDLLSQAMDRLDLDRLEELLSRLERTGMSY